MTSLYSQVDIESAPEIALYLFLSFTYASNELIDAGHELAHAHVVFELLLQVSLRHAVGGDARIDQQVEWFASDSQLPVFSRT